MKRTLASLNNFVLPILGHVKCKIRTLSPY